MAIQNKFSDYEPPQFAKPAKRNQVLEGLDAFSSGQEAGATIMDRFVKTQELMRARAMRDAAGKVLDGAMKAEADIDDGALDVRANIKSELDPYVNALKVGRPQPPKAVPTGGVTQTTGPDGQPVTTPEKDQVIETDFGPVSLTKMLLLGRQQTVIETNITNRKRDMWFKVIAENADNPTVVDVAKAKIAELMSQDKARLDASESGWNNASNLMNAKDPNKPQGDSLAEEKFAETKRHNAELERQADARITGTEDERATKKGEREAQRSVPTVAGTHTEANDATAAKEYRKRFQAFKSTEQLVTALKQLRAKYPKGTAAALNRADAAKAKSLSTQLMLAAKEAANLGVMSSTDYTFIQQLVPSDPLGFSIDSEGYNAQFDAVLDYGKAQMRGYGESYLKGGADPAFANFSLSDQQEGAAPGGKAPAASPKVPPTKGVRMKFPDGSTKIVPPDQVEHYKQWGEVVQ